MGAIVVCIRLSPDAWARYSGEANAQGIALATYLRRRLEHQDRFLENELALRAGSAAAPEAARPTPPPGELIELLIMMRQLVGPQKSAIARSEVKRQGLEIWDLDTDAPRR